MTGKQNDETKNIDVPKSLELFTRLDAWISWPVKRAIHDDQSPPHHPCITSLDFNKPKTSATLVIDSQDDLVKNKGTLTLSCW